MRAPPISLSMEARRWLGALAALGLATVVAASVLSPSRAWTSWLTAAFTWLTIPLGGLVLVALLQVSKAGWSVVVKRVAEGIAGYLPIGAASMLVVLLGLGSVYHWAGHGAHDPALHAKSAWLNPLAFAIRMAVILGLWLLLAARLRRQSTTEDTNPDAAKKRSVALSAVFLLVFAYSFSVASFDWVMSVDPHWSSTIFAFYNMSGVLLGGLAATMLATVLLRRARMLPEANENHLHDLGKLMFGMSTFWAYLWISQYLLIWYANIPEETAYYVARTGHGWRFLFYLNVVVNWLVPFLALLPRSAKRSQAQLVRVSALLVLGRWLDVYLMVAPPSQPDHAGIGVPEVAAFVGLGSLFVLAVERALRAAPLVAKGDPYLVESLHHRQ